MVVVSGRLGRFYLMAALLLPWLVSACQSVPSQRVSDARPAPEVTRYDDAHARSAALRAELERLAGRVRSDLTGAGRVGPPTLESLRQHKREYFALRETLFELALLHASAIVERMPGRDPRLTLVRTSLSLLAGTDLVLNFHAVAALLAEDPTLRAVWNEEDAEHRIPAGGWERALEAYRDSRYHDLFQRALERLDRHRDRLRDWRESGDADFALLYRDGVDQALGEAGRAWALLQARFAEEDLTGDLEILTKLVERSKLARMGWAASAPTLREAIARDGGLIRGNVHLRVQAIKQEYLELREGLYGLAFKHYVKLARPDIPYEPHFRLRAIGLSLLAAVSLYENARQIETHLLALPRARALLNQGDPALGIRPGFWDHMEREFIRPEYQTLLELGIKALEEADAARGAATPRDPIIEYVSVEIPATQAAADAGRDRTLKAVAVALRPYLRQLNMLEGGVLGEGKRQFSKVFGNLMGAVEFRKGKLFDQEEWARFVKERLRPGDLLLEKTPFRLTDKFIPGHFGHVAIYVGTERDLLELGLERHPWVALYLKQVAEGRTIVEALRDGTQINSVEHFLNIDDLAVLRPKPGQVPQRDIVQAITLAFSHIGKKYDFEFDNNTWDTIVCSELAFQTYVNVRWPFAKMLTSYTIAPDDIGVLAGSDPGRPFELVTFIHDGRVVHDRPGGLIDESLYVRVLGQRYDEALVSGR
jgi:hypothetical protein